MTSQPNFLSAVSCWESHALSLLKVIGELDFWVRLSTGSSQWKSMCHCSRTRCTSIEMQQGQSEQNSLRGNTLSFFSSWVLKWHYITFERRNNTFLYLQIKTWIQKKHECNDIIFRCFAAIAFRDLVWPVANVAKLTSKGLDVCA